MSLVRSVVACSFVAAATFASTAAFADDATPPPGSPPPAPPPHGHYVEDSPMAANISEHPLSVMLLGGYGFKDGFNFGIGGRVGYTLRNKFYIGGNFTYHFGTTDEASAEGFDVKTKVNTLYFGPEAGLELQFDRLVIRPYVGLGVAVLKASVSGTGIPSESDSENRFSIWPGILATYEIGGAFVGGDLRYVVVTNSSNDSTDNSALDALSLFAFVGTRF